MVEGRTQDKAGNETARVHKSGKYDTCDDASAQTNKLVDARGLKCPEPVMLLHNVLSSVLTGGLVEMQATDPTTVRDVRKFCLYLGHELVAYDEEGGVFTYTIRKRSKPKQ